MWWLWTGLAWAGCTVEALNVDLEAARLAGEQARLERSRVRAIEEQLACTTEELPPASAAEVHQVLGLYHAQRGDDEQAASHFLAAWEADPFRDLPEALPVDDPARVSYERLREERFDEGRDQVAISGPTPRVDGLPARWLTQGQPALVQHEASGVVLVEPGEPVPPPGLTELRASTSPLRWVGVAGVGLGLASYAGAWAARGQYQQAIDRDAPDAERVGPHAANRALSVASVGLLGLGGVSLALSF